MKQFLGKGLISYLASVRNSCDANGLNTIAKFG